jgi:hypothetical protein
MSRNRGARRDLGFVTGLMAGAGRVVADAVAGSLTGISPR